MRAIIPFAAAVCALLIGGARQGRTPPALLPKGWIAVTSPDPQADGFICAFWADTTWHVGLTRDSTALRISREATQRDSAMINVPGGGLLLGYNGGEFGGEVLYVGKDRTRT